MHDMFNQLRNNMLKLRPRRGLDSVRRPRCGDDGGFLGMGNNPMVGATVAVAVATAEAMNK